jgi:three-Cys-motif partner protein
MPLDDDDPEKWEMQEHTEVKHRILRKYLTTWTRILASSNPEVHYFDGFAGRARYEDGEPGSPLLALDVAKRHSDAFDTFHCSLNDLNDTNYSLLEQEVSVKLAKTDFPDNIQPYFHNEPFEDIALSILTSDKFQDIPSLVFIDPFGYSGTPFSVISEIMNLRRSGDEIFFTFMVEKIRRFLSDESKEEAITRAFGTDRWKDIREIDNRVEQEEEILQFYVKRLKRGVGVDHVFPFQMKHPDKDVTLYYLIHATNHFKGHKVMKSVMYREGDDDFFAYLGPDHYKYENEQMTLFESDDSDDSRADELAEHLVDEFEGQNIAYEKLIRYTYLNTDLIEKHCRRALQDLERQDRVNPNNTGPQGGYKQDTVFYFEQQNRRLSEF